MSALTRLEIRSFRNIESLAIAPASGVNLVIGKNGSGKTSLLESIHLLATGKSFRSRLIDPLIMDTCGEAIIFAEGADGRSFGLKKPRNRKHELKYNGETQKNWDEVVRAIPAQVLDASSFQLLEGGPKARRQFMDWGVFHVEPQFVAAWRQSRKALANRNQLLKSMTPDEGQLVIWDHEMAKAAKAVDAARSQYIDRLLPIFNRLYQELQANAENLTICYSRGWESGVELTDALLASRNRDLRYGSSQVGPHRADIDIRLGKRRVVEIMSRGQQKILICALKLAQGKLYEEMTSRPCQFLVDDLPAELDQDNRARVLGQLVSQGGQIFVTAVEEQALLFDASRGIDLARFHVEHGKIRA